MHPYYPRDLDIPNYKPNERSTESLLLFVGSAFTFFIVSSYIGAKQRRPTASILSCLTFVWFLLCGLLHCGFESYWLWYRNTIAERGDILAELWKEYSHGDSRYIFADPLLVTLEAITVFLWGPLCFLTVWYWWQDSPRGRYVQCVVSIGHLYSCSLYYILDILENFSHCDPHWVYKWIYFVSFNAPWIVVPGLLLANQSCFIIQMLDSNKLKNKLD
ncbi:Emopamil-binding protein [Hesseltinella vesiculosa]|uniref:Emopamil-binding protein n=1 Tax=Hesseltinella vesiculosa TaxID=101127 RepID=A0A1X2G4V9_9FUNG|nr:Emopamil-binding protein [Hesseltinella vesiculosa]